MKKLTIKRSCVAVFILALIIPITGQTVPLTITAQLTGDQRSGNPDKIVANATIKADTASNVASWVFAFNSPAHPNIQLREFYFNLAGLASDYSFSSFGPAGWTINSPASVQGISSIAIFMFEALDPLGPPNAADVTNSQNLSFTMTKLSGNFLTDDFLLAPFASSLRAGFGQLGAQSKSLNAAAGESERGFIFGRYTVSAPPAQIEVPEPQALLLFTIGLLGLVLVRRGA